MRALLPAVLLALALSASAAVVRTGKTGGSALLAFDAAAARSFQKTLAALDLKGLGLPPGLPASLIKADSEAAEQRLLLAPLALAYQEGGAAGLGPRAIKLLETGARELLDGGTADELALLKSAAGAYGLAGLRAELDEAHRAAVMGKADAIAEQLKISHEETTLSQESQESPTLKKRLPQETPFERPTLPRLEQRVGEKKGWWKSFLGFVRENWGAPAPRPLGHTPEALDYRRFVAADFWGKTAASTRAEIEKLRALGSKKAAKEYVRRAAEEVSEKLHARYGPNLGFHYNMHGGQAEEYVAEGIRATLGDRIANRNENPWTVDIRDKVFFYHSPREPLYDILDVRRMDTWWFLPSRMGWNLIVFDMDAPELEAGLASGEIALNTRASWNMSWAFTGQLKGVPYSAFLAPPLEVFSGTAKKIGWTGRLSRDEENLAALRYLEAALLSDERFVP